MAPLTLVTKANEYTGFIGIVIAAVLALDVATNDNKSNISALRHDLEISAQALAHELASVRRSVEEFKEQSRELTQRVNMELWIERARRAQTLAELPAFPDTSK